LKNYKQAIGIGRRADAVNAVSCKIVVTNNLSGFVDEPLAQMNQSNFKSLLLWIMM